MKVVEYNIPVKILFQDNREIIVRIHREEKPQPTGDFLIRHDSPLAKAIIGHQEGEVIEFESGKYYNQIRILKIF